MLSLWSEYAATLFRSMFGGLGTFTIVTISTVVSRLRLNFHSWVNGFLQYYPVSNRSIVPTHFCLPNLLTSSPTSIEIVTQARSFRSQPNY